MKKLIIALSLFAFVACKKTETIPEVDHALAIEGRYEAIQAEFRNSGTKIPLPDEAAGVYLFMKITPISLNRVEMELESISPSGREMEQSNFDVVLDGNAYKLLTLSSPPYLADISFVGTVATFEVEIENNGVADYTTFTLIKE